MEGRTNDNVSDDMSLGDLLDPIEVIDREDLMRSQVLRLFSYDKLIRIIITLAQELAQLRELLLEGGLILN